MRGRDGMKLHSWRYGGVIWDSGGIGWEVVMEWKVYGMGRGMIDCFI